MKRWKVAVLAGAGLFAVSFLIFALPTWFSWQADQARERSGAETEGTITQLTPQDHGNCEYQFEAGGKSYTGLGGGCSHESVGAEIDVYYDRGNPENSSNLVPGSNGFPFIWLSWVLIVMPVFLAIGVLRTRKRPRPSEH